MRRDLYNRALKLEKVLRRLHKNYKLKDPYRAERYAKLADMIRRMVRTGKERELEQVVKKIELEIRESGLTGVARRVSSNKTLLADDLKRVANRIDRDLRDMEKRGGVFGRRSGWR